MKSLIERKFARLSQNHGTHAAKPLCVFGVCFLLWTFAAQATERQQSVLPKAVAKGESGCVGRVPQGDHAVEIKTAVPPGNPQTSDDYYRQIFAELSLPPYPIDATHSNYTSASPASRQQPDYRLHNLQDLLSYAGYDQLRAEDLEALDSALLNDPQQLSDAVSNPDEFRGLGDQLARGKTRAILATRYMSPKIANVNYSGRPKNVGWRKQVRLLARPGSLAEAKGIGSVWLLFNYLPDSQGINDYPYKTASGNNQAMLIRSQGSTLNYPVYWLVYEALPIGRVQSFLPATFDALDPSTATSDVKPYYVPTACAFCHGGVKIEKNPSSCEWVTVADFAHGKLNYLDTDNWVDRIAVDDDFGRVADGQNSVLYDAGSYRNSCLPDDEACLQAFKAVWQLNMEIKDQNLAVSPAHSHCPEQTSFQVLAVQKWLDLHTKHTSKEPETYYVPIDEPATDKPEKEAESMRCERIRTKQQDIATGTRPLRRALDSGGQVWQNTPGEINLLKKLNQYCFRCHSSAIYNVFDKEAVQKWKPLIEAMIDPNRCEQLNDAMHPGGRWEDFWADNRFCMPADRRLNKPQLIHLRHQIKEALK